MFACIPATPNPPPVWAPTDKPGQNNRQETESTSWDEVRTAKLGRSSRGGANTRASSASSQLLGTSLTTGVGKYLLLLRACRCCAPARHPTPFTTGSAWNAKRDGSSGEGERSWALPRSGSLAGASFNARCRCLYAPAPPGDGLCLIILSGSSLGTGSSSNGRVSFFSVLVDDVLTAPISR